MDAAFVARGKKFSNERRFDAMISIPTDKGAVVYFSRREICQLSNSLRRDNRSPTISTPYTNTIQSSKRRALVDLSSNQKSSHGPVHWKWNVWEMSRRQITAMYSYVALREHVPVRDVKISLMFPLSEISEWTFIRLCHATINSLPD